MTYDMIGHIQAVGIGMTLGMARLLGNAPQDTATGNLAVNTLSLLLLGIIGYFLREYHLDMQRRMTRTEEIQAKHDRRLAELLIVNKIQTRMISKLAGEENPELIRALRPEDPDSDEVQK